MKKNKQNEFPKDIDFDNGRIKLRYFKSKGCRRKKTIDRESGRLVGIGGEPIVDGDRSKYLRQGWTMFEL